MVELAEGRFWVANPAATGRVYSINSTIPFAGVSGELLEGYTMPTFLDIGDAYMMFEYVSIEEPEAVALRSAELTYFVEQHQAIQSQASQRTLEVRVPLPLTGMAKELMWVLQRPEAEAYNAWFLFTRDLAAYEYRRPNNQNPVNPCLIPWWPNADLTPSAANEWRILPAFRTANSEPIVGASMYYNSYQRFQIEGPAMFRGILPSRYATKSAVHDRYVYYWPLGLETGDDESVYRPAGAANWDKLPRKELFLTMSGGPNCSAPPDMNVYVWVTTWNVLKVFGGRAGMLFSS
jgi:hypothetical protein